MNRRIRELLKREEERYPEHLSVEMPEVVLRQDDLEKFAKSIVQECIKLALKESQWYFDREEWESSSAIEHAVRRIKEHFKDK